MAAVDAVRRDDAEPAPPATEVGDTADLVEQLARLGVHGELALHDGACGVRLLALPSLEPAGEDQSGCVPQGAVSPDGAIVARCSDDETELFAGGGAVRAVPGCTPAWQPDGTLTVVRRGNVVTERGEPLIARSELDRAARRHPSFPDIATRVRTLVEGVAWTSRTKAAVLLSIRVSRFDGRNALSAIAFFEHGLLTEAQPYYRTTGGRLDVSPRGGYVTQTPDVILRSDGTQVNLPPHIRVVQDFAWSPDERFVALALRHAVVVVDVGSLEGYDASGGGLRSVTIPQPAARVDWR